MTDEIISNLNSLPLSDEMRCGIFSNGTGEILIIHDKELKKSPDWVEFDEMGSALLIVYKNGESQDLGIKISSKMKKNLLKGQKLKVAFIRDKKIQSVDELTIIIRDY